MKVHTIREARAQLSKLVERALRGKLRMAPDFDELPQDIAEAFGVVP